MRVDERRPSNKKTAPIKATKQPTNNSTLEPDSADDESKELCCVTPADAQQRTSPIIRTMNPKNARYTFNDQLFKRLIVPRLMFSYF